MRVALTQYDGPTVLRGLPLAVGLLSSALRDAHPGTPAPSLHTQRRPVADAVAELAGCRILGLSLYSWNLRYSLTVAEEAKRRHAPLVVVGGPSVPREAEAARDFLEAHPQVDVLVLGEGEITFVELVEAVTSGRSLDAISGIALRGADGLVRLTPPRPRQRSLSSTASPYLDGTFEALWPALADRIEMAPVETNRGCPFSCSFCDWGQATRSAVHELPLPRVLAELDWVGEHRIPHVYLVDANFGIRPRDQSIIEHLCAVHERTGFPTSCFFHLTKNARERNLRTVERLQEAGIACRMSLSMQDFDPAVLRAITRDNIPTALSLALRTQCHERGIPTFNELILGLPMQTREGFCRSVIAATTPFPADRFAIYPCRALENTALASPEHRRRYGLRTAWCATRPTRTGEPVIIEESEEIVVATDSLPPEDWAHAWRFGQLVALCAQNGLLDETYRRLVFEEDVDAVAWFDALLEALSDDRWPALRPLGALLDDSVASIQSGVALTLELPEISDRALPVEDALVLTAHADRARVIAALRSATEVHLGRSWG